MSAGEIEKLIKFIKQMEIIVRTSSNPAQVERVKKDIAKYRARLKELVPDYHPEKETVDQLARRLSSSTAAEDPSQATVNQPSKSASEVPASFAERIPEERASPHSTDPDVNFAASAIKILLREYWPALTEQHVRMDFTSSQERQALRFKVDNLVRSLKTLTETIEEYATAEKPDFREQLFKMKNKQSRLFLFEANDVFREFKGFLAKHIEGLERGGSAIKNPDETIRFDRNYEDATWLENKSVREALYDFFNFVDYVIKRMRLPTMKQGN
jgi:hypothetical protein